MLKKVSFGKTIGFKDFVYGNNASFLYLREIFVRIKK